MIGCGVGAKNTLDKNYLWLAEGLGVEVVPDTEAVRIRSVEGGYEVDTRRSVGRRIRRTWRAARVVVNSESILAADTPDRSAEWDDHVAITSGLRADERTWVEMVRFNRGSDALFWLTAPLPAEGGATLPGIFRFVWGALRRPLQLFRGLWPLGRARRTGIVLAMQTTEGRLDLEVRRRWWRLGGMGLSSRLAEGSEPPVAQVPVAREVTRRLARRAGGDAWGTWPEVVLGAPTTAHILGGCRMGATPAEGVVDFRGRVFGHPGLWVVDGSVIPVNLGVNPSLTIAAVAELFMSLVPRKDAEAP